MKQIRRWVIFLILGLALLMNVERLDVGGPNFINIDTFVYLLVVVSTIAIIAFWHFIRISTNLTLMLILVSYFFLKLLIFNRQPLYGGIYTYVTITEVTLIMLTAFISCQISAALTEIEKIIFDMILPKTSRTMVNINKAMEEQIKTEFALSRRYEQPFSVLIVEPSPDSIQAHENKIITEISRSITSLFLLKTLAGKLCKVIRRPDYFIEQPDQNRFIILCRQTDSDDLFELLDRVHKTVDTELNGISINCGVATFPKDALTYEELYKIADSHLKAKMEERKKHL